MFGDEIIYSLSWHDIHWLAFCLLTRSNNWSCCCFILIFSWLVTDFLCLIGENDLLVMITAVINPLWQFLFVVLLAPFCDGFCYAWNSSHNETLGRIFISFISIFKMPGPESQFFHVWHQRVNQERACDFWEHQGLLQQLCWVQLLWKYFIHLQFLWLAIFSFYVKFSNTAWLCVIYILLSNNIHKSLNAKGKKITNQSVFWLLLYEMHLENIWKIFIRMTSRINCRDFVK